MDMQTIVVILLASGAVFYLGRKYWRAAKSQGSGGCGCGCGGDCPAAKRAQCGGRS